MKRKIIQIAACGHDNTASTQSSYSIYALADDGSLWGMFGDGQVRWASLPPLPDPPVDARNAPDPQPEQEEEGFQP